MELSSKMMGDIGEQMVILRVLKRGWAALVPVGDRLQYDLAVDTGERLVRVQVKVVTPKESGVMQVPVRTTYMSCSGPVHRTYEEGDFDFLVACDVDADRTFVLPIGRCIENKAQISVHPSSPFAENWQSMLQ